MDAKNGPHKIDRREWTAENGALRMDCRKWIVQKRTADRMNEQQNNDSKENKMRPWTSDTTRIVDSHMSSSIVQQHEHATTSFPKGSDPRGHVAKYEDTKKEGTRKTCGDIRM